ncbi:GAF and ANTAR domain-containing protein [Streptomyces roseirectus]|uniref:GAF and ANTAR domain-containing protein n=1 Tax=Streptomyces roseirectus TaxID=2768066 RepID=A0A7H0IRH5_9ACTN|nr:GAF domain-containing protein [Streptomyces roseirectus]QNP75391.1 GAF and ANTAR domain-containing protein [Streptomyces roseirectus]
MNRERQLAEAFVTLSDTYATEFDPLHLFHHLVHTCRDLLGIDAASVMIADARGVLRTMAATDDAAAFTELLYLQTGCGPCVDCYRTGEPVALPDDGAASARWPQHAEAMADAGYRALLSLPMRLHDHSLGVLTLLREDAERVGDDDAHLAQSLADLSALALMHWTAEPAPAGDIVTRVQSVIASKATLEIAKGMVAEYARTSIPAAARLLGAYAARHRVRLTDTAQALVNRTLDVSVVSVVGREAEREVREAERSEPDG